MAVQFIHKRYFKVYDYDASSYISFADVDDAKAKIGFGTCYTAGAPTTTYALEDSSQTLVVTYEFETDADQTTFKNSVDDAWQTGNNLTGVTMKVNPLIPNNPNWESVSPAQVIVRQPRHVKTEWMHQNGGVELTFVTEF